MTSIVEVIQHYQRSIDCSQENEARLLHCINKLYKLPIKVEHLQETGVGKTVNSLRKFNGEIGVAAKALVTKWKAMVAAEEEPMDTNESETHNDIDGDGGGTTPPDGDDDNHNRNSKEQMHELSKHRTVNDKHEEKQKNGNGNSSNGLKVSQSTEKTYKNSREKHKSSSLISSKEKSSSSCKSNHKDKEREKVKNDHQINRDKHILHDHDKEKERSDKRKDEKSKSSIDGKVASSNSTNSSQLKNSSNTSSSKPKHDDKRSQSSSTKEKERSDKHKSSSKNKERTKDEKPSNNTTSSRNKHDHKSSTSSSSKYSTKDADSAERKRHYNSDNEYIDFKSPQPKMAKLPKSSLTSSPCLLAVEEEGAADDSFDSSMGANFDDVLGMLNMPVKKTKKAFKSPSTSSNNSNSASKKDTITDRDSTIRSSSGSCISNRTNESKITSTNNSSSSYSTASTSKTSNAKPDLLAPTAKLEPLDPSIVLELPTISTNYKPMPLNQTVMDCVFNNSSSSSKPIRTLSDAEAITHGISSKTMRTKIYSGVRTGQTFQVPSLFDMCIRLLQKNIDALEYTGGVPFEVLKPVLERATPQQLYVFEEYNPYLMEDSDVLWQQHVSRNYRTKKRIENESWREMFIRCQEEDERKLSVLKDSIKASQKMASAPVRKTQLAFVDSMVKPPRNVIKKQEQFGTKGKLVATPAARVASLSSVTPNAVKTGDQRLKVPQAVRDHAQVSSSSTRPKKAPLMQKTLQFIRGRHKR